MQVLQIGGELPYDLQQYSANDCSVMKATLAKSATKLRAMRDRFVSLATENILKIRASFVAVCSLNDVLDFN
jgi:hypothetical protein